MEDQDGTGKPGHQSLTEILPRILAIESPIRHHRNTQREFGSAPSSLFFVKSARLATLWLVGFLGTSIGNRREPQWTSIGLPPEETFSGQEVLFPLLGNFRLFGLDLLFGFLSRRNTPAAAVHLLGHHVISFRPFRFLLLVNVGTRRCTALRNPAGAGTLENSSPPS